MNKETLAVAGLIIGLLIGVSIGYTAFRGTAPQGAPQTVTSTYTATKTKTETKTQTEEYSVKLSYNKNTGLYLVDKEGRTLYFFAKDTNGSSSCYGACAEHWPIFYTDNLKVGPGLNPADFGVITRSNGQKQITYKGWPLYYFAGDKKPGDVNGDGVKGVWFVAKPDYTVLVAVKPGLGMYLVDDKGMTLYVFAKDTNGSSSCYGACAEKWPPFTPRQLVIPSTLNISDFSFVKRSDGTTQLAYKGQPLYYWVNDHYRGDTTGHGVKNVWFVASTEGTKG